MARPERTTSNLPPSSNESDVLAALIEIEQQLEVVDENENPIERFFKRDKLLERQAQLQIDHQE